MAKDYELATYTITLPVVTEFLNVFKPRAFVENGKSKGDPKYSATFVLPGDSPHIAPMKDKIVKVFRAEWPTKPITKELLPCWKSGNDLADELKGKGKDGERYRGKVVVRATTIKPPRLSVIDNGRLIDLTTPELLALHEAKFYPGVECLAEICFNSFSVGLTGINAYLQILVSTNKGARIAGGQQGSEVFRGYMGSFSSENPIGNDEIPF